MRIQSDIRMREGRDDIHCVYKTIEVIKHIVLDDLNEEQWAKAFANAKVKRKLIEKDILLK